MAPKIFRTGNSAVVLPVDVLEAVGLELGDEVTVIADSENSCIIITPATLPGVRVDFLERVDRFIENYCINSSRCQFGYRQQQSSMV